MVTNVANAARMQEEASILVLRIAKVTNAKVNLAEVIVFVLPPTQFDSMPSLASTYEHFVYEMSTSSSNMCLNIIAFEICMNILASNT